MTSLVSVFLSARQQSNAETAESRCVAGFRALLAAAPDDVTRRKVFHAWPSSSPLYFPHAEMDGEIARRVFGKPDDIHPYSSDLNAAWLIIQHYCDFGCSGWISDDGHCGVSAGVTNAWGDIRHVVYGYEWSEPCIALCLAALKATDARDSRQIPARGGAAGVAMRGAAV